MASRAAGVLTLFEVMGRQVPGLAELYPSIADRTGSRVVVRFETDQLGDVPALGRVGVRPLLGNNLHLRGRFPLRAPTLSPLMAQA